MSSISFSVQALLTSVFSHKPCFFNERFSSACPSRTRLCLTERLSASLVSHTQALLKNLDDTSSTADVLECLAASPQLCSEDRRALAREMEPITTPLHNWLLNLKGRASPLRGGRSSSPPPATPAAAAASTKMGVRKGKGKSSKGKSKGKGKGGGGDGGSGATSSEETGARQEPEVEAEFFSQGRRGEGNRRSTRQNPELSEVVTHNLVVLLSALHRASPGGIGVGGDDSPPIPPTTGDGGSAGADDDADSSSTPMDAASLLLAAVDAGGQLGSEQELVFGLAEPLLDACMQVAARRASPQLFGTVVETKALLRRRLWSSEDPLALDLQQKEVDVESDAAVPSIKVCGGDFWQVLALTAVNAGGSCSGQCCSLGSSSRVLSVGIFFLIRYASGSTCS